MTKIMVSIHYSSNGDGNCQRRCIVDTKERARAIEFACAWFDKLPTLGRYQERLAENAWVVRDDYAAVAIAGGLVIDLGSPEPAEEPEDDTEDLLADYGVLAVAETVELAVLPGRHRRPDGSPRDLIDEWEEIMGRELRPHEIEQLLRKPRDRTFTGYCIERTDRAVERMAGFARR